MKKIIKLLMISAFSLDAADSMDSWFKEGSVRGNIRYYYIGTEKDGGNQADTSQHSNAIGGQLGYVTGSLYGLKLGATFMTTHPFALPEGAANTEQSTLSRYNAKRPSASVSEGNQGFSVLGEAYAQYNRDNYELWYGRKVIETPLIDAKDVRMMPSSVEGAIVTVKLTPALEVSGGFIDKFKQRTSDRFEDIIESALGTKTRAITGHDGGYVLPVSISYKEGAVGGKVYDYYAPDFMNVVYADAMFTNKLNSDWSYTASVQGISEKSVGNADANLAADTTLAGGRINAQAIGLKMSTTYQDTMFVVAYSHVFSHDGEHDSLVLPWDGTPLYTNVLTANNLFGSDYGKGLTSDTAYIGGTTGMKVGIMQKLDFTGITGLSTEVSYAHYDGERFTLGAEEDVNVQLLYGIGNLSLAAKGIWVSNNTVMGNDPHATAQVNADFTQYRVIANYKF
ncbi:MAG: OprD family outer membrane porin [Sulfuricurvum sp.]|nr:OprD family outer membrane porin [Sulfuricurvum sp.]